MSVGFLPSHLVQNRFLSCPFLRRRFCGSWMVVLLLLVTFFCQGIVRSEDDGKIRILLLGDSTTEGSIPRLMKPEGPHLDQTLQHILDASGTPADVIASGLSGETIRSLIDKGRYQRDVAKLPTPDFIFIRYGINDASKDKDFITNFPKNYQELLSMLRKDHPEATIILTTIIPNLSEESSKTVNDLIQRIGAEERLPVFDIYPGYAAALKNGPNMLNYRRYPLEKIPACHHEWLKPRVHGGMVVVLDNELDALFGDLPGWYGDRHPNLAGYNVIANLTAQFLASLLQERAAKTQAPSSK